MKTAWIRCVFTVGMLLAAAGCASEETRETPAPDPEVGNVLEIGSVTDIDGNTYPALQIGAQVWMGSNLQATHGPGGELVESFCYDDQEENCQIYGRLYTMSAAMGGQRGEGAQGICPDGWHIPSMAEWKVLIDHLGGQGIAGRVLKDQNGMGLQPSGWFDFTGEYRGLGEAYFLRTSSVPNTSHANIWMIEPGSDGVERGDLHPDDAIPLRCVMD